MWEERRVDREEEKERYVKVLSLFRFIIIFFLAINFWKIRKKNPETNEMPGEEKEKKERKSQWLTFPFPFVHHQPLRIILTFGQSDGWWRGQPKVGWWRKGKERITNGFLMIFVFFFFNGRAQIKTGAIIHQLWIRSSISRVGLGWSMVHH